MDRACWTERWTEREEENVVEMDKKANEVRESRLIEKVELAMYMVVIVTDVTHTAKNARYNKTGTMVIIGANEARYLISNLVHLACEQRDNFCILNMVICLHNCTPYSNAANN